MLGRAAVEDADCGHLPLSLRAESQPIPRSHRPREHADVGDLLAGRAALDLEDGPRNWAIHVTFGRRQELRNACHQRIDAGSGECRAEEHGVHKRPPGLRRKLPAESGPRNARLVVDVRSEDRIVALSKQIGEPGREGGFGRAEAREVGGARAEIPHRTHRDDRRRHSFGDALQDALVAGAATVDLVHEDQRGNAQPL